MKTSKNIYLKWCVELLRCVALYVLWRTFIWSAQITAGHFDSSNMLNWNFLIPELRSTCVRSKSSMRWCDRLNLYKIATGICIYYTRLVFPHSEGKTLVKAGNSKSNSASKPLRMGPSSRWWLWRAVLSINKTIITHPALLYIYGHNGIERGGDRVRVHVFLSFIAIIKEEKCACMCVKSWKI